MDYTHAHMNGSGPGGFGCRITLSEVPLPEHLVLVHDNAFMLPKDGQRQLFGCHFTLYTTERMPVTKFEELYQEFLDLCTKPCIEHCPQLSAAAGPRDLPRPPDWDSYSVPCDRLTYLAMMAMESLARVSQDPSTRFFASIFAVEARALDMEFEELVERPAVAKMMAAAFDNWTAEDPMGQTDAYEIQDLLAQVLDDYQPTRPSYKPFWVSSQGT